MKTKFRIVTVISLMILALVPTSAVFAQGPGPNGGQVFFGSNFTLESGDTFDGAGAVGYVAKDAAPEELYEAVARAGRGETYVTPGFGLDSAEVPPRQLTEQRSGGLTPRQSEVLRQVALGRTGKQIAAMLGITLKTVESHRSCIARQLGLRSPAGFTRHAVQHGLIALADSSTPMGAAAPPGCPPAGGLRSSGDLRARGPARSG